MYSYREQLEIIKQISMQEGQSRSLDCPFCGGRKKFTITKTSDGMTLWNCYRASCPVKGSMQGKRSAASMRRALDKKPEIRLTKKSTPLPTMTKNFKNEPAAYQFVVENNCLEAYDNNYINIRYAPAEKRLLFYNNDETGAVGRSLANHKAKWWTYGEVTKGIHVGEGDTAVLVEDVASACSVSRLNNITGVALLGTNITEQIRNTLKKYNNIYIVLDNDASAKAILLAKSISNCVKVRLTKKDLKCLTGSQIEAVLR